MERPRLLRTYTGLRRRPGRGLARQANLGWFPPAALGGDIGEDRKQLFNSSASSGGLSFEDPDFLSPGKGRKKRGKPQRKGKERKKRVGPQRKEEKGPKENLVPPTPLRRNITLRRGALKGRPPSPFPAQGEAPQLCSTPQVTARPCLGEGPGRWDAIYGFRAEALRGGGPHDQDNDVFPGLSFFAMSPEEEEEEEEEEGLCTEAPFHGGHDRPAVLQREGEASPRRREDQSDSDAQPQSSRHHWEGSPPLQSQSAERPNDIGSKSEKGLCAEHHPSALPRKGETSSRQRESSVADSPFQHHITEQLNAIWSKEKASLRQREDRSDSAAQPQDIGREGKALSRQREDRSDSAVKPQDFGRKRNASLRQRQDRSESAVKPPDIGREGKALSRQRKDRSDSAAQPQDIGREGKALSRQREGSAANPPSQHCSTKALNDIWSKKKASSRHREDQSDSAVQPQSLRHHQDYSVDDTPFQNNSVQPQDIQSKEKTSSRHWEDQSDSAAQPQSSRCCQEDSAADLLFQSHCTERTNDVWSKGKVSSRQQENQSDSASLFQDIQSKEEVFSRRQEDFVACSIQDQTMAVSLKTETATSKGAFQLQARFCGGKLALSLLRDHTPLSQKRQRMKETPTVLDGASSEELNEGRIDGNSPLLQPIVVLDNQAVPNWLANQSSQEQVADCCSQKTEDAFRPRSPCNLPSRSNRQPGPVYNTGTTGRKACISGFSSKRWGQQKKPKKRHGKKNRVETALLQQSLKNQVDDDYNNNNLALSFLSPESSFQNSALWRRIRASFSFHKKKKILSESESFSGSSIGAGSSFRLHGNETPQSPFTQRLGYSICPSSSMVLLSSFSMSQVMPTDAEKVYGECQQKGPVSFEECIPLRMMRKCQKIGEGVFGEVFRAEGERGAVALKIIPIEGSERVNGEPQKTFGEILPEIIISKELSLLAEDSEEANQTSGFIRLHSVHCVQGAYPEPLLAAWDEFHRRRTSENDRPDFFGAQQLFMVLEFEDGGTDLENMCQRKLGSVAAAKSVLQQVAASLAVAEEALRFEHRDLHWGNVLIKSTNLKEVSVRLKGETLVFPTHGILVSIIDYTFSRLERDGLTVYCDLSTDEEVFQGRGDYQFDIYRQMREENANDWADYFPHSNILWLHYLAEKLLTEVTYKRKPTTPALKQLQNKLKLFSGDLLDFRSAGDLLNRSPFFQ